MQHSSWAQHRVDGGLQHPGSAQMPRLCLAQRLPQTGAAIANWVSMASWGMWKSLELLKIIPKEARLWARKITCLGQVLRLPLMLILSPSPIPPNRGEAP